MHCMDMSLAKMPLSLPHRGNLIQYNTATSVAKYIMNMLVYSNYLIHS